MLSSSLISLALLGLAGALIDGHRRAWRKLAGCDVAGVAERSFGQARFRRRMLASSAIGVIGLLLGLGPLVPRKPLWMAGYLALLGAGCGALVLLGGLDALATGRHQRRQLQALSEQLKPSRIEVPKSHD
jgi:hypothetical protein